MKEFLPTLRFDAQRAAAMLDGGFLEATALAEYLVEKGLPFRECHAISGTLVRLCEDRGCRLADLTLTEMRQVCPRIGADGMMLQREADITLDKIRTIFRIGMMQGHDSLILSAMGCGAFANPPAHIAKLFHQVIEEDEFKDKFRLIDFAILDGYKTGLRHNPEGNFAPFQKEFA